MSRRVRVVVAGRVQGVGFREGCRAAAAEQGLRGWVRNRPDGTVEAVVDGDADAVEALVAWCRHGPPAAGVTGVERSEEPPGASPTGFEVR